MNDLPCHKLSEIVATYGPDLWEDPFWTEALLNDLCGQYEREIAALVTAQKSGIPTDLLARAKDMSGDIVVAQLTAQLVETLPLEEDAARWAVESWALALGVISSASDSLVANSHPTQSNAGQVSIADSNVDESLKAASTGPIAPSPLPSELVLGTTWVRPADGMPMVYVPAGEFPMGSDHGDEDEKPVHMVALDGFWIDCTPVTNAQFARFLKQQGNQMEGGRTWLEQDHSHIAGPGYEDHPVVAASWYGAAAYARWAGGRLPTEAEWEYAARGPEGRVYPWGDRFDAKRFNCGQSGIEGTTSVLQCPNGRSWCGAWDMAGNVWEWVADWYGDYPAEKQANPTGSAFGPLRVLRGGSFIDYHKHGRCADRFRHYPDVVGHYIGFGLAAAA